MPHLPQEIWSHILSFLLNDPVAESWLWLTLRKTSLPIASEIEYLFRTQRLPQTTILFQLYDSATSSHNYDKLPVVEYVFDRADSRGMAYLRMLERNRDGEGHGSAKGEEDLPYVAHFLGGLRRSEDGGWRRDGEPWWFTFFSAWIRLYIHCHSSGNAQDIYTMKREEKDEKEKDWYNLPFPPFLDSDPSPELPNLQISHTFREIRFDWRACFDKRYAERARAACLETFPLGEKMGFLKYDLPLQLTRSELRSWRLSVGVEAEGWRVARSIGLEAQA